MTFEQLVYHAFTTRQITEREAIEFLRNRFGILDLCIFLVKAWSEIGKLRDMADARKEKVGC